jgi:hypothetical protein
MMFIKLINNFVMSFKIQGIKLRGDKIKQETKQKSNKTVKS